MMENIQDELTPDEIMEMEDERLQKMNGAGINEQKVLSEARTNLNIWSNYFNENQTRGKDDMNFTLRDQWTAVERSEFTRLFKPAMTFNKLYDATKKIAGEQRKNKPDLLVRSLTGKATQEAINLRADMVRTISYQSQNDLVYQTAFKAALLRGYGAFQLDIDYEAPRSFNKIIKFGIVPDPTYTYFDPKALKPHKGDGDYCARVYIYGKQEFAATFPFITNPVPFSDPRTLLDFQWLTQDTMVVCDYFKKDWFPLLIYKLSNGLAVTASQWEELQKNFALRKEMAVDSSILDGMIDKELPKIIDERQTQDFRLMHYRLLQNQMIDFTIWPSKYLPIIFVDGDSHYIDGQQYTRSFIHEAKDAQKFVNYVGCEVAAEVKNRRREQWLATPDNITGNEQMWRNAELQMGVLIAKPDPKTGGMPTKQSAWELSQTLLSQYQRGNMDIKEILGFSEAEQNSSRDISGKAKQERKLEGSMSAYVYFDNLNQAIEQAGRVVLDLLPVVYGEDERTVIVTKKDGRSEPVTLNKLLSDGQIENEISAGEFDIEIDTGPSFAVQKEVALQFLQQTIQAAPQTFNLYADLWAKNLDVQFMPQLAERLKTLVPPQILAKEEGKELPPTPPSPQEMMMQAEVKLKQQALMERADELRIRQEKHDLEKLEIMANMRKLQDELQMTGVDHAVELKKANLNYTAKMADILKDLHKHAA